MSGPHSRAPLRLLAAALALLALTAAAGCADAGELKNAGATPAAVGPTSLWPDRPAASVPPLDYGEGETAKVPGIKVPDGDVRRVKPLDVVRAEEKADPDGYTGADGTYEGTAAKLRACAAEPKACPVLRAYYRDLTDDGEDELILGVDLPKGQLVVRCYQARDGGLTRIMDSSDAVIGVALAGRNLIVRAPSNIAGYEYRTSWSWDGRQRAMLPTSDEILPTGRDGEPSPSPSPSRTRSGGGS